MTDPKKKDKDLVPKAGEATTPATQATSETALEAGAQDTGAVGTTIPLIDVRHGMFGVSGSGDTSGYGAMALGIEALTALAPTSAAVPRNPLRDSMLASINDRRRRQPGRWSSDGTLFVFLPSRRR